MKEAISTLVTIKSILNAGTEGKESYYVDEQINFILFPGVLDSTSDSYTKPTHSVTPDAEEISDIFEMVVSRKLKDLVSAEFSNFKGEENFQNRLITALESKITFLRNEVMSKDKIIEILVKESDNNYQQVVNKPSMIKDEWKSIPDGQFWKFDDNNIRMRNSKNDAKLSNTVNPGVYCRDFETKKCPNY